MGQTYNDPGYTWAVLVEPDMIGDLPHDQPMAVWALASGSVLRWVDTGSVVNQQTITDPSVAADWSTPAATVQVIASSPNALAVASDGTVLRLFTGDQAGTGIVYRESSNWGATWGSPVTLTTRACVDHLHAHWDEDYQGGAWILCWTSTDGAWIGWDDGSWTEEQYTSSDSWRAAGIAGRGSANSLSCYFFRYALNTGPSALVYETYLQNLDSFVDERELDRLMGGLNGMGHDGVRIRECGEMTRAWVTERGYDSGAVVALGAFLNDASMDEPVAYPAWAYVRQVDMIDVDGYAYIVGSSMVVQGTPKTVSVETFTPIKYVYHEGKADLLFPATVPTISPGDRLDVARTLSDREGNESSQTLRFWVADVERWTDKTIVVVYDAVGYLGIQRVRRMSVVLGSDGTNTYESMVYQTAARSGVPVLAVDSALTDYTAPPMNLRPGENFLSTMQRLAERRSLYLVPSPDEFTGSAIAPGYDVDGELYTPYAYGPAAHPLIRAAVTEDGRRFSQAFIYGQSSLDPEDGVSFYMAEGPRLLGVRPISMSRISQFLNSDTKREETGDALVNFQERQVVDAKLESWANLGLELYDKITVTESAFGWSSKAFLVVGIKESWEQGRLWQELDLREWPFG